MSIINLAFKMRLKMLFIADNAVIGLQIVPGTAFPVACFYFYKYRSAEENKSASTCKVCYENSRMGLKCMFKLFVLFIPFASPFANHKLIFKCALLTAIYNVHKNTVIAKMFILLLKKYRNEKTRCRCRIHVPLLL